MENFQKTRGKGYNVFLSDKRLFIVNADSGVRVADFCVDEDLLNALRKAFKINNDSQNATKKKNKKRSEE